MVTAPGGRRYQPRYTPPMLALQSAAMFGMASVVIPLLILYFGLIAWLTFDASKDSNWVIWLFLFLGGGPVTIPLYIIVAARARATTSQDRLDEDAEGRRNAFKFATEIDRVKWIAGLEQSGGTMYEPSVGLNLRRDRHATFRDERAEQLLADGDPDAAYEYLSSMYEIAREQADTTRAAGFRHYIEARLPDGAARLRQLDGLPPEEPQPPAAPRQVQPPGPPKAADRQVPF